MVTKAEVNDFLGEKSLAVVGVSRNGNKFGNALVGELDRMGYKVFAIHPDTNEINGRTCYEGFSALPETVGGVVVSVRPEHTEQVVRDAYEAGIRKIWIQQGSESPGAIAFAKQNGMLVIHDHCVLMFAEPQLVFHKIHRVINGMIGRNPR